MGQFYSNEGMSTKDMSHLIHSNPHLLKHQQIEEVPMSETFSNGNNNTYGTNNLHRYQNQYNDWNDGKATPMIEEYPESLTHYGTADFRDFRSQNGCRTANNPTRPKITNKSLE